MRHVSIHLKDTTRIIDKITLTFSKFMRTLTYHNLYHSHFIILKSLTLKAKSLRVLDLSDTVLKDVPVSIDNLKHLRYLNLSKTYIETLPEATTRLFHLQTLKLEDCNYLRELPKGIKNLKNLRHLYIGECHHLMYMPGGMGNLICLRTLSKYVVGSKTGSGSIRELKELKISGEFELCGLNNVKNGEDAKEARLSSKHDLQFVTLRWDDIDEQSVEKVEEVIECLQPPQNVRQLNIYCYPGTIFPNWMMMCATHLPNLVEIHLSGGRCEHLPALGHLHSLEVLEISRMVGVKYIGGGQSSFHGVFPSLKALELYDMANLEEWVGWEVTGASSCFPQLVELKIRYCPKMKSMPHVPSVQKLHVSNCPLLLPEKGFFLKMNFLKELYMYKCGNLALLLSNEEVRDNTFPRHLESVQISSCDELTSLSDEFMYHLSSLKKLEISECKNLVGLPSLSSSSTGIRGESWLQLQYLTTLETLVIRDCEKLICDQLELPQSPCLQVLRLQQCPNLRSLPEELQCLTALQRLLIFECENLVSLPQSMGCLTALRELQIISCENLVSLPQSFGCFTALQKLWISECENLVSLLDGLGCLTALETLMITKCSGITTLPESLGCLNNLRYLTIGSNSLLSLPQSLGCLTDLTYLKIKDIAWASLPDCLGRLTALEFLSISQCTELTSLPEGLEGLTRLEQLEIANCPKLVSLPERLQRQLPKLQSIYIYNCPILQRQCATGGKYWRLVSHIPNRIIQSLSSSNENNQRVLGSCNPRSILCGSS